MTTQRDTPGARMSWISWAGPVGVAVVALGLRLWNLGHPNEFVFDETYYAKDAYSLSEHGYVQRFVDDADSLIPRGVLENVFIPEPSQIVHPEGGKWLLAAGIELFGMDSFGWRVAAAVVGALTVFVLARLVFRLTGSVAVGCFAGALLALDGLHFTMSRLALLDVFLTFWLVCSVTCLVADRRWISGRIRVGWLRPWQLAAGACFGMAVATKWSGLYVLAVFGLLAVVWEASVRHDLAGRWAARMLSAGVPAFGRIVGIAAVVYLVSWTGWLMHADDYEARFAASHSWGAWAEKPDDGSVVRDLRDLVAYHQQIYAFHTGDYIRERSHPYASHPAGWLLMDRPVSAYADNDLPAKDCGAAEDSSCMRQILLIGNPVIWWTGAAALIIAAIAWARSRHWRWGVPVLGAASVWLPWFASADRPIFSFYMVALVPFTIIAISLVAHRAVLWARRRSRAARLSVAGAVGVFLGLVLATFILYFPIYTGLLISYDRWRSLVLFDRWV